jgi:homoserine dehydrogenase
VPVIVLGCGNVAQALLTQITIASELHAHRYGLQFDVLALADSSGFVLAKPAVGGSAPQAGTGAALHSALTRRDLAAAIELKEQKKGLHQHALGVRGSAAELIADVTSHTRCIVVDASGADGTAPILLQALERGSAAVTANKKPMSDAQSLWNSMHAPSLRHRLRYESTVGAGTPMIVSLARVIASGDPVRKILGSFSGTLGYVMTGLEAGKSYSTVVSEAVRLGYTEPDPRDDLGGVDVGRKALILARMLGRKAEMKDVQIEPLYDSSALQALSVPEFIGALHSQDAFYAEKIAQARASGSVLRYVASIDEPAGPISVGLMALSADSPLGRLQGTGNLVEFHTTVYGDQPLVVQGAGAGGAVTAVGILADMVEVATTIL